MNERKVVSRTFVIGNAKYRIHIRQSEEFIAELECNVIRDFLKSMNKQGELGFWEETVYEDDPIGLEEHA